MAGCRTHKEDRPDSLNIDYTNTPVSGERIITICSGLMAAGLIIVSAGFFMLPDYGAVARCFHLLVALPVAVLAVSRPAALRTPLGSALLFLGLPAYLALSVSWGLADSNASADAYWDGVKPLLFLGLLLLGASGALNRYPQLLDWLPRALVIVALPSALLALGRYLPTAFDSGNWPRLAGISLRGDINVTAALYGIACLCCAWGLTRWPERWRPWLYSTLLVCLPAILLSQSKVALLLALLSLLWVLRLTIRRDGWRYALLFGVTGLLVLAFFAGFERIPFFYRSEAYSVRLDLWAQAIDQWRDQPWLGHGLGADLPLTRFDLPYHSHSHNFLIGTLRYGGLLGAALLILQIGGCLYRVWRLQLWHGAAGLILLWWLAGIGFLLTNGSQPLVKPHHMWFFYWIPLALLLTIQGEDQKPCTS